MKVALINPSFSASRGGLERFSVNLARALCCSGHQVHAYGQSFADLPKEVRCHPLAVARKPAWWRILGFSRAVRRAIDNERFDVTLGLVRASGLDVYRMGDGLQTHWMRIRYPFAPWRWLNYLLNPAHLASLYLERQLLGRTSTTRIITNSRLVKDQAAAYYGIADDRTTVVYNGVDHAQFSPRAREDFRDAERSRLGLGYSDILLLHVSNNWPRKGLGTTMRAMHQIGPAGRHLHLMVIGRGRMAPFRKLARRLQLESRVFFAGTSDHIERFYAAADVMVLPTLYDPFSNVCLEAMACGLPVITTSQNGAAELIVDGENGWVQHDARSPAELTRLLLHCLNPETLSTMGGVSVEKSRDFTPARNMQEILAVCTRSERT